MKNLVRRARLVSEYFVRALTLQGLSQQIYIQRAVWIGVLEELSCLRKCFLHVANVFWRRFVSILSVTITNADVTRVLHLFVLPVQHCNVHLTCLPNMQ